MKTLRHWCGRFAHVSMSHGELLYDENTDTPCNYYTCKCGWSMTGLHGVPSEMKPGHRKAMDQIRQAAQAMRSGK